MRMKTALIISTIVLFFTGTLLVVGNTFEKPKNERLNGMSDIFALSSKKKIAYVKYEDGKSNLFIADENLKKSELIDVVDADHIITHLAFSKNGNKLLYIQNKKEYDQIITDEDYKKIESQLFEFNLDENNRTLLIKDENSIADAYYMKNDSSIIYSYSLEVEDFKIPRSTISREIYEYNVKTKQHEKITHGNHKTIGVSSDQENVYVTTLKGNNLGYIPLKANSFLKIPPKDHGDPMKLSLPAKEVSDFTISADGNFIAFDSLANPDTDSTYYYEIFLYNFETKEETQLTTLKKRAFSPSFLIDGSRVYFMVETSWGKDGKDQYALYYFDVKHKRVVNLTE